MKDIIYFCNPVSINKLSSISSFSESISYCWKDLNDDYCNYFKSTHYTMPLFFNMNREDTEVSLFSNNDDSFPMLARIERSFIRESVLNKDNPEINIKSSGDYQASLANMLLSRYIQVQNIYLDSSKIKLSKSDFK